MKRYLNRRSLALMSVLLASQLLSACIIVPRPYHRFPVVVVEPGYNGPPPGAYPDRRGWNHR